MVDRGVGAADTVSLHDAVALFDTEDMQGGVARILEKGGARNARYGRRRRRTFTITKAGKATLQEWLRKSGPIPFELRDIGLVKLFFADALDQDDALTLLAAVKRRSEERVAMLRSIEPAAHSSEQEGNIYPILTLEMGVVFHQAMLGVCSDFEQKMVTGRRRAARQ